MKRGEVYWADLAPRSGSEQQGRRPVIVISHDAFNQTQADKHHKAFSHYGRATIEPHQGLFLSESWRLHSDICTFT